MKTKGKKTFNGFNSSGPQISKTSEGKSKENINNSIISVDKIMPGEIKFNQVDGKEVHNKAAEQEDPIT